MNDLSDKQMTAAVVGLGHIAKQHFAAVQTLPYVHIAAICDRSPATAEATAERFGIERWYVDFDQMLEETRPDVVHVTTPPSSHAFLATAALEAGAHVIVEKPAAPTLPEVTNLLALANDRQRHFIEDYNYVFNPEVQHLLGLITSGELGDVCHVDLFLCLDVGAVKGGATNNESTACLTGGLVGDFLPHFASLTHALVGESLDVHTQWPSPIDFRAMIRGQRGTANIGFCPFAQPNAFWLRVYGSKMQVSMNLFEPHLVMRRQHAGPPPLIPLRNGLAESKQARRSAWRGLTRKLSGGPGAYEGLASLVTRSYDAMHAGSPMPITLDDIASVNQLVHQLGSRECVA